MFRRFTSERVRQRRRKRFVIFSIIYALLVVSLFLFLWQLSYASFLRVDRVVIDGEKTVAREEIFAVTQTYLSGVYGHLFSKRNIFLYPRGELQEALLNTFPSMQKVSITSKGTHTVHIHIVEREGVARVCRQVTSETGLGDCYFLDESAFIFITAPHFAGSSYITYELQLAAVPIGTYAFTREEFTALSDFAQSLNTASLRVIRVRVTGDEVDATVMTSLRGEIHLLFKKNSAYGDVFNNLQTVIESEDFKKASELQNIEYIDLRFGNKVFYREKEQTEDTSAVESVSELQPL